MGTQRVPVMTFSMCFEFDPTIQFIVILPKYWRRPSVNIRSASVKWVEMASRYSNLLQLSKTKIRTTMSIFSSFSINVISNCQPRAVVRLLNTLANSL